MDKFNLNIFSNIEKRNIISVIDLWSKLNII